MKKNIFILFFITVIPQVLFAQNYEIQQALDFYRTNKMMNGGWKNTLTEKKISLKTDLVQLVGY